MATAAAAIGGAFPGCGGEARPGLEIDVSARPSPALSAQTSGTDARLIGLSVIDADVAWFGGTGGTVGRTLDGGETWSTSVVPGANSLQFRDVHAVDADVAYVLSIGSGSDSRIYKTTDGGVSWSLQFTNQEPDGFFDCFDFWDPDHGIAFSDAVDGAFGLVVTRDGETWERLEPETIPVASEGEGGFAASGTCLITLDEASVMFGTGAGERARVIRSQDRGRTWSEHDVPIADGTATSGVTSLAFLDTRQGAVFGGEIGEPEASADNVGITSDGGRTWRAGTRTTFPGAVYGAAYVPGAATPTLVAVGPGGMDVSRDNGASWVPIDTLEYWSVDFSASGTGWAIGPGGRVTRIDF